MATVFAAQLIARARQRADMPVAGFVADDAFGIYAWINEGGQKLHELLVKAFGESFVETTSAFTTVAGTADYSLPNDFLALYGVDITIGGIRYALQPYKNAERNLSYNGTMAVMSGWQRRPRYRLIGQSTLRLLPAPDGAYTGSIIYAPSFSLMTVAGSQASYPNGWERYIVVYTAIQMLMKEESDVRELRTELAKMEAELEEIAARRDIGQPHSAVDMESVEDDNDFNYI